MAKNSNTSKNRKPLYIQIYDYIQQEIAEERLKVHDRVYESKELQDLFNVSKITTEKAFKALMDNGLIYRIPGKGTFVSDLSSKRIPAFESKKCVVFVCPNFKSHHIINIIGGIESVLTSEGHRLQLVSTYGSFSQQESILNSLLNDQIDGMIVYPVEGKYYDEVILRMKISRFPFVLVDKHLEKIDTSFVISDNFTGSFQGTKELLNHGHRNIAFFSSYTAASSSSISDRINGFIKAMDEAGVPNPKNLVFDGFDEEVGSHLTYDLPHREKFIQKIRFFLEQHSEITALLAISPGNMSHVVRALRVIDPEIAKKLEIAIFDLDEFLDYSRTPLFCINQKSWEMGEEAARIILQQIKDPMTVQKKILDMEIKTI
ncbi:GntR family transcriptional regulator [Marispirochaeta sp.]|uniref:GntR family transcriptional regulator n=1 Tax=Marispirochaeta sp. TaxID=2038653 RepID=UPI0029C6D8D2|nr:GntR family transcriptional regulator [Marispirochaeta sp.]